MRLAVWIVGVCWFCGSTSVGLAAGNPHSLRLLNEQYEARHAEFAAELEDVAQLAAVEHPPGTVAALRELALPFRDQPQDVDRLPEDVQAELPADLSVSERHWRSQLLRVRRAYAQDLYLLSRKALKAKHVSLAFQLIREVAFHDPDHRLARKLLGYVRHEDRWVTPHTQLMLRRGNVMHERFGWLPASHVEKYESGQRNFRGRWMSAEDEATRRHDFRNAWEIETDHFRILTNHSLERGVQVGVLLEKFHRFFRREFAAVFDTPQQMQKLFEGGAVSQKSRRPHLVHYYQSRAEFVARLSDKQPGIEMSNGLYLPQERTTHAFFSADPAANEETLLHEVTHQLLSESQLRVPDVGREANFWLIEGIACYLESFEIDERGRVRVGDPRHIRIQNARDRLLAMNFFVPLRKFTELGMWAYQHPPNGDTLSGYYSQGSGLTHFFLHYEDGIYRDALIAHLAQIYSPIARIRAQPNSLSELTGVSIDELDRQYRSYLTEMQSALDLASADDSQER